jgi:hypothetical protein
MSARANTVRLALLASLTAALAGPAAASAGTFCVNMPATSCLLGTQTATIQEALTTAETNGAQDIVKIGAKATPYDEDQLVYDSAEKVEIVGAGAEQTVLTGSGDFPAVTVISPASVISDLAIDVPDAAMRTGLRTDAKARRIAIRYAGQAYANGAQMLAGARLEDVNVEMSDGVGVIGTGGPASVDVRDSRISAGTGVRLAAGSSGYLSRVRIRAANSGITVHDASLDAVNVVIEGSTPTAWGLAALSGADVSVWHGSLIGGGSGIGAKADAGVFTGSTLELTSTVIAGYDKSLVRTADPGGAADLTARYSSFAGVGAIFSHGPGTLAIAGNGNAIDVDPQFTDPDGAAPDYTPRPGSPLVDAADPQGFLTSDALGRPRPVDGDGTDGPRPDIGAFERDPAPPAGEPAGPGDPQDAPPPPAGVPTGSSPADPAPTASAPTLRIGPKRVRLRKRGFARLRLTCTGPVTAACRGTLRVQRRRKLLGKRTYSVLAGRRVAVRVRIARAARRTVRRRGRLVVRVRTGGVARRVTLLPSR